MCVSPSPLSQLRDICMMYSCTVYAYIMYEYFMHTSSCIHDICIHDSYIYIYMDMYIWHMLCDMCIYGTYMRNVICDIWHMWVYEIWLHMHVYDMTGRGRCMRSASLYDYSKQLLCYTYVRSILNTLGTCFIIVLPCGGILDRPSLIETHRTPVFVIVSFLNIVFDWCLHWHF
jgi:hypothetical protein